MRNKIEKLYVNPKYSKLIEWSKHLSITGATQILIQILGLISGIIVIRFLSPQEYALYILANTLLGTMTLLSDGGISIGIMAEGGKIYQHKDKLGAVVVTGLSLRKKFSIFSLLTFLPVLVYLLYHHGANWFSIVFIIISIIPAFNAALSDSILQIPIMLNQDIKSLQKNQMKVSVGRFILNWLGLFMFPYAFIAIFAAGVPRIWGNIRLKKVTNVFADLKQKDDPQTKKKILKIVSLILPGAIYYCISGQLTIWLISIFGETNSIAEIGALGRIAMVLTVITTMNSTLVTPRFARLPGDKVLIYKKVIQIVFVLIIVCIMTISLCILLSNQILSILGDSYKGLETELVLCIIGSCITMIWNVIFSLYSSRGWVLHPLISISVSVLAVISGVLYFDIHTLKGVLYFNIFIAVIELLLHGLFMVFRVRKIQYV